MLIDRAEQCHLVSEWQYSSVAFRELCVRALWPIGASIDPTPQPLAAAASCHHLPVMAAYLEGKQGCVEGGSLQHWVRQGGRPCNGDGMH